MTDAELEGLAAQALNLARRDLERGRFSCLIAVADGASLFRMRKVEALFERQFGEDWLNHGALKDAVFSALRSMLLLVPPQAFFFVTVGNFFSPTAKFDALPEPDKRKLLDKGHDAHHRAVVAGLFTVHDVLQVIAQTAERVCMRIMPLGENSAPLDAEAITTNWFDQEHFAGRLKMF